MGGQSRWSKLCDSVSTQQSAKLRVKRDKIILTWWSWDPGSLQLRRMQRVDKVEEPATFERVVLKNASVYHYMKVCLVLENDSTRLSAVELKQLIVTSLKKLHGEVGAALSFDVLKYDEVALTALLRVHSRGLVKLWSSLTLLGCYLDQACCFRVLQVSPFLLPLSGNSRELDLD